MKHRNPLKNVKKFIIKWLINFNDKLLYYYYFSIFKKYDKRHKNSSTY